MGDGEEKPQPPDPMTVVLDILKRGGAKPAEGTELLPGHAPTAVLGLYEEIRKLNATIEVLLRKR